MRVVILLLLFGAEVAFATQCRSLTKSSYRQKLNTQIACAGVYATKHLNFNIGRCLALRNSFQGTVRRINQACRAPNEASLSHKNYLRQLNPKITQYQKDAEQLRVARATEAKKWKDVKPVWRTAASPQKPPHMAANSK